MSPCLADLQERLLRLKSVEVERSKTCSDYVAASSPSCTAADYDASASRLRRIFSARGETLQAISDMNFPAEVLSQAAYIMDRYLSTFVPEYVAGAIKVPHRISIIGVASVFIAVKTSPLVDWKQIVPFTEGYLEQLFDAEMKILIALKWDVNYPSPITIIRDLMGLLPRPTGHHEHDSALVEFEEGILEAASYLTKLAAINYGFITKFCPTAIALAALKVVLEHMRPPSNLAVLNLIGSSVEYFGIMFEACELPLSFGDEGVEQCRKMLLQLLEIDSPMEDTCTRSRSGSSEHAKTTAPQDAAVHSITP